MSFFSAEKNAPSLTALCPKPCATRTKDFQATHRLKITLPMVADRVLLAPAKDQQMRSEEKKRE